MPFLKCENCGHIHWDESPVLKETYEMMREEVFVSTTDVAEHFDITLQNANNRLKRLEDLGVCTVQREAQESGGYYNKYVLEPEGYAV